MTGPRGGTHFVTNGPTPDASRENLPGLEG